MQTSGRRVRARERGRKVVNRSVGARDSTPHIQRQTGGVPRGGARVAFPTGGRSGSETISRRRSRAHAWPSSGGGRVVLWWARARSDEESVQPTRRSACRCVSVVRRGFNAAGDALQPCCTSRRVPARGPPSAIPSPACVACWTALMPRNLSLQQATTTPSALLPTASAHGRAASLACLWWWCLGSAGRHHDARARIQQSSSSQRVVTIEKLSTTRPALTSDCATLPNFTPSRSASSFTLQIWPECCTPCPRAAP